jgi:hypothetical protein
MFVENLESFPDKPRLTGINFAVCPPNAKNGEGPKRNNLKRAMILITTSVFGYQ